MDLKNKLKILRKEHGLTQQDIADSINVSRSVVAKWETGLVIPKDELLKDLALIFKVPVSELKTNNNNTSINKNKRYQMQFESIKNSKACALKKLIKANSDIIFVPSTFLDRPVVSILKNAFEGLSFETIVIPESIIEIDNNVFNNNSLKYIYYKGNQKQWDKIKIGEDNKGLEDVTIIFNYCKVANKDLFLKY